MKLAFLFALLASLAPASHAVLGNYAEINLSDGSILRDARFVSQSANRVTFQVGSSLRQIDKRLLPVELQRRYPVADDLGKVSASPALSGGEQSPGATNPKMVTKDDQAKQVLLLEALHYANMKAWLVYRQAGNGMVPEVERQERSWREMISHFRVTMDQEELGEQFSAAKEIITGLKLSNGGKAVVWQPRVMLMAVPITEFGKIVAWRPATSLHPLAVLFEMGANGKVAAWSIH